VRVAAVQRAIEMPSESPPLAGKEPTALPPLDASAVPSPSGGQPSFEDIDLERLADEVYAIIEQRLIIERESRGL
jgi:hypothetical protein